MNRIKEFVRVNRDDIIITIGVSFMSSIIFHNLIRINYNTENINRNIIELHKSLYELKRKN